MIIKKKLIKQNEERKKENLIGKVFSKRITRKKFLVDSLILSLGGLFLGNCKSSNNVKKDKRIIVIGAGISGLAAAYTLNNAGYEVIVLEARNRIGGRIKTINFNGFKMDAGASWIHGTTNNPLYAFTQENNITTIATYADPSYLYDVDGSEITYDDWKEVEKNLEYLCDKAYDYPEKSLEEVSDIVEHQLSLSDRMRRLYYGAVRTEYEIPDGGDGKELSSIVLISNDSFPGDNVLFPDGMEKVTAALAKGLDIRLNRFVTKINYESDSIEIFYTDSSNVKDKISPYSNGDFSSLSNEKMVKADIVIVTLPVGVLKRNIVRFVPELPSYKVEAIERITTGSMNKVFLYFEKSFWPDDGYFFEYFKEDYENMMVFESFSTMGIKNILLAFLAGKQSRMAEKEDIPTVKELVMNELKSMFGTSIPEPKDIYKTSWYTDPFALGSYPHIPPGSNLSFADKIAEPIDNRVFFVGDSTTSDYLSTAHGAYISGISAANKIINL